MTELAFAGSYATRARETSEVPQDGLHILSNFSSKHTSLLTHHAAFRAFIDTEILQHQLTKVGEAYHDFAGGGFTGVVCLAESHLSIHTWPDRNYITFDIYLSNHTRDNSEAAVAIYKSVVSFFDATVVFEESIKR